MSFGLFTSQRFAFTGTFASSFRCLAQNASKSAGSFSPCAIFPTSAPAPPSKNTPFSTNQFSPGAGLSRCTRFPSAPTRCASTCTKPGFAIEVTTCPTSPTFAGNLPLSFFPSSPRRSHSTVHSPAGSASIFSRERVKVIFSPARYSVGALSVRPTSRAASNGPAYEASEKSAAQAERIRMLMAISPSVCGHSTIFRQCQKEKIRRGALQMCRAQAFFSLSRRSLSRRWRW